MALIEVKGLCKTFEDAGETATAALNGIHLSIEKGSFDALAGPSGSGKTTLLNLIGALDTPTAGQIFYHGKEITRIPIHKLSEFRLREVGFIFQAYNLINTLTALENTEYVLLLQGVDAKTRRRKSEEALQRVGLGDYLHRRPSKLSGGQQQRVAVARALAAEPSVILADEPTANLDSVTAAHLLDLMKELNREKGITFLFSTHDKMVMDKADTVYRMKDGSIIEGNPSAQP